MEHEFEIKGFLFNYPMYANKVVDWYRNNYGELVVKLDNGTILQYDIYNETLRELRPDNYEWPEREYRREFGRRLSRVMLHKRVTQIELSQRTGIAQTTISKYITGKATPSSYNFRKIIKALNCSVDYLMLRD